MPQKTQVTTITLYTAWAIRSIGYCLSFGVGLALWPQLMEWGYKLENVQFGLSVLLNWFCLPVSMGITHVISAITMGIAHLMDASSTPPNLRSQIQRASVLGVLATLGSCGMIASGYEPPERLHSIYELDLSDKYR